jgi:hypothetical protein
MAGTMAQLELSARENEFCCPPNILRVPPTKLQLDDHLYLQPLGAE